MTHNANSVLAALETALKTAVQLYGGDKTTSLKDQLDTIQALKDDPFHNDGIDFHDRSNGGTLDTLIAMCEQGPLWDGDLPSKTARDQLVRGGYACHISVKGEQGYNAATYKGNRLLCQYYGVDTLDQAKAARITKRTMASLSGSTGHNVFKIIDLISNRPGLILIEDVNLPANGYDNRFNVENIEHGTGFTILRHFDGRGKLMWIVDNNREVELDSEGKCEIVTQDKKRVTFIFRGDPSPVPVFRRYDKDAPPVSIQLYRDIIEGRATWENKS